MPTALELTRKEWRKYIDSASRRPMMPQPSEKERKRRDQLLIRIRDVARVLKTTFGVRRVMLFGSLAQTNVFRPDSDVDLAVEGLERRSYWKAWKMAEDHIGDRQVDLVEIEMATESLKKAIERYGIEL